MKDSTTVRAVRLRGWPLLLAGLMLAHGAPAQQPGKWAGDPCGYFKNRASGVCTPRGNWRIKISENQHRVFFSNGTQKVVTLSDAQVNTAGEDEEDQISAEIDAEEPQS